MRGEVREAGRARQQLVPPDVPQDVGRVCLLLWAVGSDARSPTSSDWCSSGDPVHWCGSV